MNNTDVVTLSTGSYNSIKNENCKHKLFLDNLLYEASLSPDHQHLVWDSETIENALKFCYLDPYKKRLATLRTQASRYGAKEENKNE